MHYWCPGAPIAETVPDAAVENGVLDGEVRHLEAVVHPSK
jgi:hypothetical protein